MADLLNEIRRYCAAGNFTEQQKFVDYLNAYAERLNVVRAKCEQLNTFLSHNMIVEATNFYNQQHPSLRDQVNELRFPGLQDWLDAAEDIYGLEVPVPIDGSILKRFAEAVSLQNGLQGELAEFRQIASGNDLQRKTKLARQIHQKQPENAQWTKTLRELEEKCKNTVAAQAKEAILNHQENTLQELYDYLQQEPWTVPPRSEVLTKISRTLHEWRLEALGCQAETVASEIDRLYCEDFQGNLEILGKYFRRWDSICSEEQDFVPPETAKSLVEEVRSLWEQKDQEIRREKEQQEQFECRLQELQAIMDQGGTCEELESRYHALLSVGRGVPDGDEQRYRACYECAGIQRRRRQLFRSIILFILCVIAGGLALFAWAAFREVHLCKEYVSRMKTILADSKREATECDAILKEVEEKHPELLAKSAMENIRNSVMERQQEQREVRTQAENRITHIEELLADYKCNHSAIRDSLMVLKKMTLTSSLQEAVDALEQTIEQRQSAFAAECKKEFRRAQLEAEANLGMLDQELTNAKLLRTRAKLREILQQLETLESGLTDTDQESCQKLRKRIEEKITLD